MEPTLDPIRLNVVVYEDGDLWVAQAIEFDIAARADKVSKITRAFERALVANLAVIMTLAGQRSMASARRRGNFRSFSKRPVSTSASGIA
jgi:hypothetical protein